MLEVGQQVRVLEPFTRDFPDVYTITQVEVTPDNVTIYFIGDIEGAFDAIYLEVVV